MTQPPVETCTRGETSAPAPASGEGRLVFAEEHGTGRLFHGRVLSLHTGSLGLLLDHAPQPRARLSLELRPAARPYAAEPLLVTARVRGCEATADGVVVRLRITRPRIGRRPVRALPVEDECAPPAPAMPQDADPAATSRDRRWLLLVLLMLLALWLWPWDERVATTEADAAAAYANSFATSAPTPVTSLDVEPPETLPDPSSSPTIANDFADQRLQPPVPPGVPPAPPLRFMRGERLRRPADGPSPPGIALGGSAAPVGEPATPGAASGGSASGTRDGGADDPERNGAGADAGDDGAYLPPAWRDDPPPVAVRVRRDAFVVEVLVHGAVTARMPAGLGRDGSTPTGMFTLTNKIVNPVWYNRGDPVPPGDPRNALGGHWLGLADGTDRVPYGFHDAAGEGDLGNAVSRGCIRLRPEDAARLMRMAPVGTPVCICE